MQNMGLILLWRLIIIRIYKILRRMQLKDK